MKRLLLLAAAGTAALSFSGCESPAKVIDANGNETITSLDKVDIQDFARAADNLVQSLMKSPAFEEIAAAAKDKKPVIAISSVRNDTADQFDTDLLTTKINAALINTRKVKISTTVAGSGQTTDALAKELRQKDDFAAGRDSVRPSPEYTLSGKIIQSNAKAGSTKQTSYVFQMALTKVSDGTSEWIDERIVTKQGSKNSVGF